MNVSEHIDSYYGSIPEEEPRDYIGASGIGDPCTAALGFCLRGFPGTAPAPRTKRIFRDGHRIEDLVVADLKAAGYRVWELDPDTGRQWHYEIHGGHVCGNSDGQIEDGSYIRGLEIKSMNDKKFKEFKRKGIKSSHPKYFDQMQFLMGLSGIESWMMVAYNKNDSDYHDEVVEFDPLHYSFLVNKAESVLRGEAQKISNDPDYWICRFCFKKEACHQKIDVPQKCETCAYAKPTKKGFWWCGLHNTYANNPCDDWVVWEPKPAKEKSNGKKS